MENFNQSAVRILDHIKDIPLRSLFARDFRRLRGILSRVLRSSVVTGGYEEVWALSNTSRSPC